MTNSTLRHPSLMGLSLVALAGCHGEIGEGSVLTEPSTNVLGCDELQALPIPMRRLTKAQYENTIVDLFAGAVAPSDLFPESDTSYAFDSYADANHMTTLGAEQILHSAEQVGADVADQITMLLPCAPQGDAACAEELVRTIGGRAFRRPVRAEEVARLMGVFESTTDPDFAVRAGSVVVAMLQMPQFLYLVEEGRSAPDEYNRVTLTGYEVASRLSYLLWNTMPDEALLAAAEAGQLDTPEGIVAEAQRLLSDHTRATPALVRFYREWLGLGDLLATTAKSTALFPTFEATLPAMNEEIDRFIASVLWGEGSLETLLTTESTTVNAELAAFYGLDIPPPTTEDGWTDVTVPGRPGILTRAGIMAHYAGIERSSYVRRGQLVRAELLCAPLPPPPVAATTFEFPEGLTSRGRSALLNEKEECASCHSLLDPLGLSLEGFDATGAVTTVDSAGEALDLSGNIVDGGDASGPFVGPAELVAQLAQSEVVERCVVGKWFSYYAARDGGLHDECTLDELGATFAASGDNLQDLVLAIVATDGFRVRRIDLGESQ